MKKLLTIMLAIFISLIILSGVAGAGFLLLYMPSLTADFGDKTGPITSNASGFLYGLAEPGVPSENMTESINISTASQKVAGGLQHPIGDISHVYKQLDNTKYNVVYLQDAYSTWYYDHENIEKMRAQNTYNWKEYVKNDFFPRVKKEVETLSKSEYADKVVYCLYNECDNGLWFGETRKNDDGGVYGEYNETGAANFFEAWKMTYDYVRSINPNALIGGPGFMDYNYDKLNAFLSFCVKNDCLPDIMIYHELSDYSVYFWRFHVREYRELEEALGMDRLPIIVTEYGRMQDCGLPGKMVQYITQIELSGVYGNIAYWRLADNLCDVAADDNSPNSNWWLYRWYADMDGQAAAVKYQDLFRSNFENAVKKKAPYTSQGFMGIASITDDEDRVDVVCGGRKGFACVKLKNLDKTALKGKTVNIKVEETVFKGLTGIVSEPVVISEHHAKIGSSSVKIYLSNMDEANAYHITLEPLNESNDTDYDNSLFRQRYEFENGTLLGNAYTYDSAYATTGEQEGMVGGMENEGDGVSLTFTVPKEADYTLDIIYGNANDGEWDENGRQHPDGRVDSTVVMTLDGEEQIISLPNTIKSEYTSCYPMTFKLGKGDHTLSFKHNTGTIVLDSMYISEQVENASIAVLKDGDRTNENNKSFLAVAPCDGFYELNIGLEEGTFTGDAYINNHKFAAGEFNTVYLMRGLNYIDISSAEAVSAVVSSIDGYEPVSITADKAELSDGAKLMSEKNGTPYIGKISSDGGSAKFTVKADKAGTYAVTLNYSNNDEGGLHDYNVDLIERFVTLTVNGKSQDVFCRNTYSWDTYKTVTAYVKLAEGSNTLTLSNSGNIRFNNGETYAPHIAYFTLNPIKQ